MYDGTIPERPHIQIANPGRDRWALARQGADPWHHLAFWEAEHQAHEGLQFLRRGPYFVVTESLTADQDLWVPTAMLYPAAAIPDHSDEWVALAQDVAATVREAHEYARAAMLVPETTRPVLHFYAAELLAHAVSRAILGPAAVIARRGHGLSAPSDGSEIPIMIRWQPSGDFATFYRAVRWDTAYGGERERLPHPKPQFHGWECLRRLRLFDISGSMTWPPPHRLTSDMWKAHRRLLRAVPPRPDVAPFSDPRSFALTRDSLRCEPLFDLPDVLVEYMVLYYLSILARYYPVAWREHLAGRTPDGYWWREALQDIFPEFLANITSLLPHPDPRDGIGRPAEWITARPTPETVQQSLDLPPDTVGLASAPRFLHPRPAPWYPRDFDNAHDE